MSKVNSGVALPLWVVTLGALLVFLSMAALVIGVMQGPVAGDASETPPLYDEQMVVSLYEKANPAVVRVETVINTPDRFGFLFPHGGQGSGFLVDTEGHILTNYHVVHDASTVQVVLPNGETLDAKVAGRSPADDVALLKVDAKDVAGIEPLPLADSSAIETGQMAIAVGSPFGLDNSVTVGVSQRRGAEPAGCPSRPITGMIQTDASLNPGNSGGPC
ncbi:Protease Do-like 1, chloroplastic [Geodia barretti]|uniref:Protease Do-like 1, chloroplastic n=1 Tax=Geodia barretti TaxID=519541 RepID=A0AA35TY20_GEOBA|nr:Protease Do-like 1, chloroplastic [Geodia barretti]